MIAHVSDDGRHPCLQPLCVLQSIERSEDDHEGIMQQVFCYFGFVRILSADMKQLRFVLLIKQVQGLTFTSPAPAYQFCCIHFCISLFHI